MNWKQGSKSVYVVQARDTSATSFDIQTSRVVDTITRTILSIHETFMGESNVMVYKDSSSRTHAVTIGRMSQSPGDDILIYNYNEDVYKGLYAGGTLDDIGWVTYQRFHSFGSWTAASEKYFYDRYSWAYTSDDEAETKPDETITIQGKSYTAKHILHTIGIMRENTSLNSYYRIYVDSYVVPELGAIVKEVVHTFTPSANLVVGGTNKMLVSQSN